MLHKFIFSFIFLASSLHANIVPNIILDTWYGKYTIDEPVLCELIESKAVQRLKHINQYGVLDYIIAPQYFNRYDHSIRVMVTLRRFGASLLEQIAGLLHDVSHTVFSHVGDHVFKQVSNKDSYQDGIHIWYLNRTDIPEILNTYGITIADIDHKDNGFTMLEQDLPDICADRLSYTIDGGLIEHKLTYYDIRTMLDHVHFQDGVWFFDDVTIARKFADVSMHLHLNLFNTAWNFVIYDWTAQVLLRAVEIDLITLDDIHFSVDDVVWDILNKSSDKEIQKLLYKAYNYNDFFALGSPDDHDKYFKGKCRCINPLVKIQDGLKRLAELDQEFDLRLKDVQKLTSDGWYIKYTQSKKRTNE